MRGFQLNSLANALTPYVPDDLRKIGGVPEFRYIMDMDGEHEIASDDGPVIAYFENPRDYWSVRQLPSAGASIGGKDIQFVSATLTRTDDRVTHKLNADVLPNFDGSRVNPPFRRVDPSTPMDRRPLGEILPSRAFVQQGYG
jgi:hypothetical protein